MENTNGNPDKVSSKHRSMRVTGKRLPQEIEVDPQACVYGLFIRMSHEKSVMNGSVERHLEKIRDDAKKLGVKLNEKCLYSLEAVSGGTIINHPAVIQMMQDLRAGRIQGILFTKLARFCRNREELRHFAKEFRRNGWQFRSLSENIDTRTLQGRMFFDLISLFAEWERETISERVSDSIAPRAKQGSNLGGRPKYGFEWKAEVVENRKIWSIGYKDNEKEIVRCIVETFLIERSYRRTARIVSKKYLTRKGFGWSDSRVFEILTNPIYRGDWIRNMRTCGDDNLVYLKPECEWVELERFFKDPIIGHSEAKAIDEIIEIIKTGHKGMCIPTKYLLTQISCHCGGKVYGRKYTRGGTYYKCDSCDNRILVDEMDNIVLSSLESIIEAPGALQRIFKQVDDYCSSFAGMKRELVGLKKASRELNETILKQNEKYDANLMDIDSFRLIMSDLESRRKVVSARTGEIEDSLAFEITREQVVTYLNNLKDVRIALKDKESDTKRRLVGLMLPSIVLGQDEMQLSIAYMPTMPKLSLSLGGENAPILYDLGCAEKVQRTGRG